jgi:hypothetical protein
VNPDDISPADVYARVGELEALVRAAVWWGKVLAAVIALLILEQLWKAGLIYRTGRRITLHLDMAATHGAVTDSQTRRMEGTMAEATAVLEDVRERMGNLMGRADLAAEAATVAAGAAEEVKGILGRVEHQTNSLAAERVAGAGREGVTEGREQMRDEATARGDVRGTGPTMRDRIEEVGADIKDVQETARRIEDAVKPADGESER